MAYTKNTWVDQLDTGNKYTIMDNPDDTKAIEYAGEITRAGTPMNAENFNHMEQGIYDAHEAAAQLGEDKVDKVTGKGLSTNDYTTTEKTKLAGLSNYDDTTVNNSMVRAGDADSNGQNQLYKTVNGVSTNIDPKCSLATMASGVHQQFTGTDKIRPLLMSNKEGNTGTLANDGPTLYSNYIWANPSTGELHAPMFKGSINTKVNLESTTTNAWRKICEYSSENHRNSIGQCGIVIEMLVYNTKDTSPKGGTALLKIMTYTAPNYPDKNELFIDFSAGRVNRNNVFAYMDPSSFKLTYTDVDGERIYKLWYYVTNANMGTSFTILSAVSAYQSKPIVSDINLFWGTLSTGVDGYLNDDGVAATGVVDCEMGVIGNDIAGNAATATSSTQTRQTLTTSNNNRPLLVSSSTNTSDTTANVTGTVQRTNNIYANASTGTLTATSFVGNLTGNATSSTSISKNQDLLFDGVFTNNSLVIQDLFTNWKLIFMQLTWVKNQTTYTRELVLPLNILVARTTFTIRLHTGDQVVFWKVDNNTIKHGTTYGSDTKFFAEAIVMGIY